MKTTIAMNNALRYYSQEKLITKNGENTIPSDIITVRDYHTMLDRICTNAFLPVNFLAK